MKPVVLYSKLLAEPVVGQCAYCTPTNHTSPLVSNQRPVLTSTVIRVDEDHGEFETLNSIYQLAPR